jgi:hypothetical protein
VVPLKLRTGTVVAVTAAAAAGLFGGGVILGAALDHSDSKAQPGYRVERSASRDSPVTSTLVERDGAGRTSAGKQADRTPRKPSSTQSGDPAIPVEERLNRSLLVTRQDYLDQASVTRYQKALENEVAYGYCKRASSGHYRCTVVELDPKVDPRELKMECLRAAINLRERRRCARLPTPTRSQSTIDFDVNLQSGGCWVALRPGKIDPTGSAKLEGCLSDG